MKLERLQRLLQLVSLLQGSKGYNVESLALECGVHRRTIFRDLDMLRQAGIPLLFDEPRQRYHVPATHFLPPTNFTTEEALSLLVLCYQLGDQGQIPFYAPACSAALKLESNLPPRLRSQLREMTQSMTIQLEPRNALNGQLPVYQTLRTAAAQRKAVRIAYESYAEAKDLTTRLSPYQLLFSRRSWYVIGRSSVHRETRTFNVGRIRHAELLPDSFKLPRGFTIDRYLRNAWHLVPEPGPDREVLIRFQPLVARNVAEVVWHKTQKTTLNEDGTLDFRVTVSGLGEISWWILGYGDQAEVLEPQELRTVIHERAKKLLARYEGEPAADDVRPI